MKTQVTILLAGVASMLLPACNGMFDGIYDEPETAGEYGFIERCSGTKPGTIYINATDYETWTYINLDEMQIYPIGVNDEPPAEWDFAVHRYDTKTNDGGVAATSLSDISLAGSLTDPDRLTYIPDEWTTDKIVTDMSTMMDGYLSYADSYYNPELSEWLDVDTSTMPPDYTMSDIVYILRMSDGKKAALKLRNYMNDAGVKGYMTIQYVYPI